MKAQIKLFLAVLATLTLLIASVFTAFAGGPQWQSAQPAAMVHPAMAAPPLPGIGEVRAQADDCDDMEAMEVSDPALWFATDEDQIAYPDIVVESYPTGTNAVAAGFEYKCIPKGSNLTIIFKYGGFDAEPWVTASARLAPTNRPYVYHHMVYSTDGSAFIDSDFEVEFYLNEEPMTQGEIMLGEGKDGKDGKNEQATVQGTIVDGKTRKPIKGAIIFILEPGTTAEEWIKADMPEDELYTGAKTDAKGKFVCDRKIDRNVTYSVLVGAKGYKPLVADDFMVDEEDEDPVDLTIKLYK